MVTPPSNLTPQQIVQWFRQQAKEFAATANRLEALFGQSANISSGDGHGSLRTETTRESQPSIQEIKAAMGVYSVRLGELAPRLQTSVGYLRDVMTSENGFVAGERGWYSVAKAENGS